jgi:ketosteroid isomerase-like protein
MKSHILLLAAVTAMGAVAAPMARAAEPADAMNAARADGAANQAVVEGLYRAFAAGDGPAIGALLDPGLVWIEAENGPYADRNPYNGPQAVFEGVFARLGAAFEGFTATPVAFVASGDEVVAIGRYTGTHRATGEALDAQFVHVFTVTGGRIAHFQQYTDTAQWMDVVTPD